MEYTHPAPESLHEREVADFSESPSGSQQKCGLRLPDGKHPHWLAKGLSRRGASRSEPSTHNQASHTSEKITAFREENKIVMGHYFMIEIFNHNDWDSETKEGVKTHGHRCRSTAMSSRWSKSNDSLLRKYWYKPSLCLCPTTSTKQIGLFRGMLYKISSAKKAIVLKAETTWCLHQL